MNQTSCFATSTHALHCALELSKKSWLLAIQFPDREQPTSRCAPHAHALAHHSTPTRWLSSARAASTTVTGRSFGTLTTPVVDFVRHRSRRQGGAGRLYPADGRKFGAGRKSELISPQP